MNEEIKKALENLIDAARPMPCSKMIDETSGTIPYMEALRKAVNDAEKVLDLPLTKYEKIGL